MEKRLLVIVSLAIASLAPVAFAQNWGETSGPTTGKPVKPSGAVPKENPSIPHTQKKNVATPSGTSAGEPGVEGKKGTQSGKEATPPPVSQRR